MNFYNQAMLPNNQYENEEGMLAINHMDNQGIVPINHFDNHRLNMPMNHMENQGMLPYNHMGNQAYHRFGNHQAFVPINRMGNQGMMPMHHINNHHGALLPLPHMNNHGMMHLYNPQAFLPVNHIEHHQPAMQINYVNNQFMLPIQHMNNQAMPPPINHYARQANHHSDGQLVERQESGKKFQFAPPMHPMGDPRKYMCMKDEESEPADVKPNVPNRIDNLNNIFFEQIFEKIEYLSDQVRMARAYPQFIDTIVKMWCRCEDYRIVGPNTPYLRDLDIDDYVFFMTHMAPHFKEFHVNEDGWGSFSEFYEYIMHLCDIEVLSFPKVEVAIFHGNPDTMIDEDFRDLTVILPNVKRMETHMNISGRYLQGFIRLEDLSFKSTYHSVPLNSCCMQNVLLGMTSLRVLDITDHFDSSLRLHDIKLPNLEVLKINLSSIENMVEQVMALPKLKKLCVRFDDSRQLNASCETVFQQVIATKSQTITAISLNNEVVQLPNNWYRSIQLPLPKLRKLVCENWNGNDLFLDKPYISFEQLQVVGFSGWETLRYYRLLELVRESVDLEHLHLNEYHSHISLLATFERIRAADKIRGRKPLNVFSDTHWSAASNAERYEWFRNPHVRMTLDSTEYEFQDDGFEIDFE